MKWKPLTTNPFTVFAVMLVTALLVECSVPKDGTNPPGKGHAKRPYLYFADNGYNNVGSISCFAIPSTGIPSPLLTVTTGTYAYDIAITPSGMYLYVTINSAGSILPFSIGLDGTLSALSPASTADHYPWGIAISPNGHYIYVTNNISNTISAFSIGANGALTTISGSFATGSGPGEIAISPDGHFLYVANNGGTISAFSIGANGVLSAVSGVFTAISSPIGVTISRDGLYLYVTCQWLFGPSPTNGVFAFTIASDGKLSPLSPVSFFATDLGPVGIATDPSGQYLYTANFSSSTLSAFSIGTTGALSPISGSIATGVEPMGVAASLR